MQVQTHLFGNIDVNPDSVITFPSGLVGFPDARRYTLVHETDRVETANFTLQSLDEPALAFQIIDPTAVGLNYELALTDEESAALQAPAAEDVAVMLILYKQEANGGAGIGANLRAPLLINTRARLGLQKVIEKVRPNITISNLASVV